jgi:hypothetical protein
MIGSCRLIFCLFLLVVGAGAQAQPVDANRVRELSELVMMMGPLQTMRDTCANLFPAQATVIRGLYDASAVPTYAKLFDYEVKSPPPLDRDRELESLGMSEGEASSWCFTDFPATLDQFDEQYGNRVQEMKEALNGIEKALAAKPSTAPQPEPSPQPAQLDNLFARIVEASNRAYETGDWSVFADLYEPGTFDCWEGVRDARQFAFLSLPPLSAKATFKVSKFTTYLIGGRFAFTNGTPTHLMEVSDEFSSPGGRCGLKERQRWPRKHFYLVQRGSEFSLTHFCPSKEDVGAGSVILGRPLSAAQAAANMAEITDGEWQSISEDLKKDRYASPEDRLRRDHRFNYEEAYSVVDYVCDPSNMPYGQ